MVEVAENSMSDVLPANLFELPPERPSIKSLLPWYGSKRTLAPRIVKELGKHRAYVEPFAGSMAVLIEKPRVSVEIVNDLHADLINLARVIRNPILGPIFYRRVRRWSLHAGVIDDAKSILKTATDPVDRAVAYFAMSWLGLNGYSGTEKEFQNVNTAVRYTLLGGGDPVTRFKSAIAAAYWIGKRLRHVDIRSEDAIALCERIKDVPGQCFYVDPPYLEKGARYLHDFASSDHARLARALCRFKATRIVVSYYDSPDLDSLYPGWTKVDCSMVKSLVSQGRRDSKHSAIAPEVLLINGESYTAA